MTRVLAQAPAGLDTAASSPFRSDALAALSFSGYGVVNYYAYDWQTLPDRRNAIDPERLNLYLYYDFSERIQLKTEIEFEHGGTGSTLEFDPLEEFGEFEASVEKGGQIVLEQINLLFAIDPRFRVRAGKMRIYFGNAAEQDEPTEYFTAYRSEVENTILPLGWYETGVELSGQFGLRQNRPYPHVAYRAYVMSGLDNTGFTSRNWIRRGYQTRFETINADALAYAVRLDYVWGRGSEVGFNVYAGDATPNRPKADFTAPSWVTFGDVHFTTEAHPWRLRAYGMLGHVQNSQVLSAANRNLSNNLQVTRTPVGKAAYGAYAEAAYDFLPGLAPKFAQDGQRQLYAFGRTEWYDSMWQTQGNVAENPRYARSVYTAGLNYFPHPNIVLKTHYAWRSLGSGEHENTYALGLGFDF